MRRLVSCLATLALLAWAPPVNAAPPTASDRARGPAGRGGLREVMAQGGHRVSDAAGLLLVEGKLFLAARFPGAGVELAVVENGAPAQLVKDLREGGQSSEPTWLTRVGDSVVLVANDGGSERLFVSDGTADGTVALGAAVPGLLPADPANLVAFADGVLLTGRDDAGQALWGWSPADGVRRLAHLGPATAVIEPPAVVGETAYFSVDGRLMAYNGTDLRVIETAVEGIESLTPFGTTLLFSGVDPRGRELFRLGTGGSPEIVADICPTICSGLAQDAEIFVSGARAWFGADDTTGVHLHYWDGSVVRRVGDIVSGGPFNPRDFSAAGEAVLFSATDGPGGHGRELWAALINAQGVATTAMVADLNPGIASSDPSRAAWDGQWAHFAATTEAHGREPFKSDLTAEGTRVTVDLKKGPSPSNPRSYVGSTGRVFFRADAPPHGIAPGRSSPSEESGLYTEGGPWASEIITPTNGSELAPFTSVGFSWNDGAVGFDEEYWLEIGTTVGGHEVYGASQGRRQSVAVSGLPTNGRAVYARIWNRVSEYLGGGWYYNDFSYTAYDGRARITSPAPGSTLAADTVDFVWNPGTGVSEYWLEVGTTVRGREIYGATQGTGLSRTVGSLPRTGQVIYVTLWSLMSGTWEVRDYTYQAFDPRAVLTSPAAGSTLRAPAVEFAWSEGTGATEYWLSIGNTGVGSNNLYEQSTGLSRTRSVPMPAAFGATLYFRLWTLAFGNWLYRDYTFTNDSRAVISSPAAGSELPGPTATFSWAPTAGALEYWLDLSSSSAFPMDIFNQTAGTALSIQVTNLPLDNRTIYPRLWTRIAGPTWAYTDFPTFKASNAIARLVSPDPAPPQPNVAPSLSGRDVTFTWTAAAGASDYRLRISTAPGFSGDIYDASQGLSMSALVTGLPVDARLVNVDVITTLQGQAILRNYPFRAYDGFAKLLSPPDLATLAWGSTTFVWEPGLAEEFRLLVGSSSSTSEYVDFTTSSQTSYTATSLPTNGSTVVARFMARVGAVWSTTTRYLTASAGTEGGMVRLVTDSLTNPSAGDLAAKARLEAMGFGVQLGLGEVGEDAGMRLVVISSGASAQAISNLANSPVPILTWNPNAMIATGLGNNASLVSNTSAGWVAEPAHRLAAGRTDVVALTTNPSTLVWDEPQEDGIVVVGIFGTSRYALVSALERGAKRGSSLTAPARRVGVWGPPLDLTGEGYALFDHAVRWATEGVPIALLLTGTGATPAEAVSWRQLHLAGFQVRRAIAAGASTSDASVVSHK